MRIVVAIMLWLGLTLTLNLSLAPPAAAQDVAAPVDANPEARVDEARIALHAAATGVNTTALTDQDIESRMASIPPIQAKLRDALGELTPRQEDLQARQAQLGPAPGPNAPAEDPRTAQIRRNLGRALTAVTADVQEARLLSLAADQTSATLSDRLRENFTARLGARSRSVLDPGLWRDFADALPADVVRLGRTVTDERQQADPAARIAGKVTIAALALAAGLFLLGPARVILNGLGFRRAARAPGEARLRRILMALWLVLVATVTPLMAGIILRAALSAIDGMTPDVNQITGLLVRTAVFAAFLEGLGRALLSPGRPQWRLAPIPNDVVSRLAPFPGLVGLAAALSTFVDKLGGILGASLATRVATDCLTLLLELAVVGGALATVGRARVAHRAAGGEAQTNPESRLPWILAILAAWAAVITALVAVLIGYLALASFLMRETVWIAAILACLFLMLRLADDLFPALVAPKAPMGAALETALGLTDGAMEQIGVLFSGVARLVLLFVAWIAILLPVGSSVEDIFHRFTATDYVIRFGLVSVSPGAVLGGVGLFLAGLYITGAVRRWLEVRYLPKTALDMGLRTSLSTGVTYLGGLIAILVAFAYLGLSIAQIALFASALSVGIGFGLQSIISNFVSGLILLAERPVRVGDWIAIGENEGDVMKINIRATEIEMADRSRLIVPNSELVSKAVRNVTHAGAVGRVKIVLKVDGSSDPGAVRDLILARLKSHPRILGDPAPSVYMTDVRDGDLEFTAFAYVASPRLAYGVKSELLFQIVPDLRVAGITLANPTPVVNVGMTDHLLEPAPAGPDTKA